MARGFVLWTILALSAGLPACEALAAETAATTHKPRQAIPTAVTLDAFVQKALADGSLDKMPGPIAELIGVPKDVPYYSVGLSSDQTTDSMFHGFMVMFEQSSGSDTIKPLGLAVSTVYAWPGNRENYWFRTSLKGRLEKVVVIYGKRDEQGKAIKGSGTTAEKDIHSPEIKKRFQHEMDLWLKKTYLKKEWRSADFSQGALQKKGLVR